jgi:putative flippase GtrA
MGATLHAPVHHRRAAMFVPAAVGMVDDVVPQLSRYTAVSALALGVDFLVFLTLAGPALRPSLAGAAGYAIGLAVHYALSVRHVFDAGSAGKSQARLLGEFIASGIVGLVITTLVIAAATELFGLPPLAAKIAAVAASFLVVYLLRREIVFAAR